MVTLRIGARHELGAGRYISLEALLAHLIHLLGRDEDDGGVARNAGRADRHASGSRDRIVRHFDYGVDIALTKRIVERLKLPAQAFRSPANGFPAGSATNAS